jgi:cation:H+ antiporter
VTALLFLAGIVLLVVGADLLVRGASRLSLSAGLSPLVVGLTVVALGPSAPELAVSMKAAVAGSTGMAFGNVVGSNIANVLLILGLAALAAPLGIAPAVLRRDLPFLLAVSLMAALLALDGRLGPVDGLLLLATGAAHVVVSLRQERTASSGPDPEGPSAQGGGPLVDALSIGGGLALLVGGAHLLVGAATTVARSLGVSDLVVGLTVVAVGTSLPEIAASVLASIRGQREIAVGNVVGSNVLNLAIVLALTAIVARGGIDVPPEALKVDTPVMVLAALLCVPVFLRRREVTRADGALFVFLYVLYTAWLALKAQESPHLALLESIVLFAVAPALGAALLVWPVRRLRQRRLARRSSSGPAA